MEKEISLGDILTLQEHSWIGSTPKYETIRSKDELYIPDGVLRGAITIEEAIRERKRRSFIGGGIIATLLGIYDESVAISLEDINPATRQTRGDPRILGIVDRNTKQIEPAMDKRTGEMRELTREYINFLKERELEEKLHLRSQSLEERESVPSSETVKDRP